jgi:hypothetical protein
MVCRSLDVAVAAVELEAYICSNLGLQGGNNVFKQQPSHIIIAMFSVCFSYYSILLSFPYFVVRL